MQLNFLLNVFPVLNRFLTLSKVTISKIHLLYSASKELLQTILLRFMKTETVSNKRGNQLMNIDGKDIKNLRPVEEIKIGKCIK